MRFRPWWSEERKAQPIHNFCLVHEIRRINLDEISVTTSGANPAACAWLADEAADELPAEIAGGARTLGDRPTGPISRCQPAQGSGQAPEAGQRHGEGRPRVGAGCFGEAIMATVRLPVRVGRGHAASHTVGRRSPPTARRSRCSATRGMGANSLSRSKCISLPQ